MLNALKNGTLKRGKSRRGTTGGSSDEAAKKGSFTGNTAPRRMFRRRTTQGDSTSSIDPAPTKGAQRKNRMMLVTDPKENQNASMKGTLSLKSLLGDVESQLEFEQFLESQHAGENLRLWQELKFYRDGLIDAVLGDAVPLSYLGGRAGIPSRVTEEEGVDESSIASGSKRDLFARAQSVRASLRKRSFVASMKLINRKSAPTRKPKVHEESKASEVDAESSPGSTSRAASTKELLEVTREREEHAVYLEEAKRLFDKYIDDNATHWVCTDNNTIKTLRRQLEEEPESVDRDFFLSVQRQIYKTMQQDLLPRFLKSKYAPTTTGNGS